MDKLPDELLRLVFLNLNAKDLTRFELVSSKWKRVAQQSWTVGAADGINMAYFYKKNQYDAVMRKCGPYLKEFLFTSHQLVDVEMNVLHGSVERYDARNVKTVHIENTFSHPFSGRMLQFLGEFERVEELILSQCFPNSSPKYPDMLSFTSSMPNLTAIYFTIGDGFLFTSTAASTAVMEALNLKLRSLHLEFYGEGGFDASLISQLCLLTKLKELSLLFTDNTLNDKDLLKIARSCSELEAVMIYHPLTFSELTCLDAVDHILHKVKMFWICGKFLVPHITTREDLDQAQRLLAACWARKSYLEPRYHADSPRDIFDYDFDESESSYSCTPLYSDKYDPPGYGDGYDDDDDDDFHYFSLDDA